MSSALARPQQPPAVLIEELQDRVQELTEIVAGRSWQQGPVAGLSPQQTMIVGAIATRGRIDRDALIVLLRAHSYEFEAVTALKVQVMHARRRLEPHGIAIQAVAGFGWQMDAASRRRWAALSAPPPHITELLAADAAQREAIS
jgi:hypothetical protein